MVDRNGQRPKTVSTTSGVLRCRPQVAGRVFFRHWQKGRQNWRNEQQTYPTKCSSRVKTQYEFIRSVLSNASEALKQPDENHGE